MNANLRRSLAASICLVLPLAAGASDWPQWRGPTRTGHAGLDAAAPATLPAELKPVWKIPAGPGFSSPVIARGQLLFLEFKDGQEVAHLVDAATGKDIWQTPFSEAFEDEWGAGPRSTPILEGDRAYVQSCRGEFRCLNLADGKVIWGTSYEKDFGVKFLGSKANEGTASRRGNNGCGVIDGDRIVLPVGNVNGASLVCFDKATGKVLWKTGDDEAGYSSFVVATLGGMKQVVALTADALLGADLKEGKILWRVPFKTNAKRHAASPVILGDVVTVNSHTIGLVATRVTQAGGTWKAAPAWTNTDLKINLATPVVVDGALYCQGRTRITSAPMRARAN
jgi:outer membrane protein assembly factor BamB